MLWMLKERDFFYKVINVLRSRNIFDVNVWHYAFFHKDDAELMRECLMMSPPVDIIN